MRDQATGPWLSLASLFRVTWSPHGPGHALVLLQDPAAPHAHNIVLTDNEPMARFCVQDYLSHFAAFRGSPLLDTIPYRKLDSVTRGGDGLATYTEHVIAPGLDVLLTWANLGTPYAVDMAPDLTATGKHRMLSLFVDSDDAHITVNGTRLPGRVFPRPVAGRDSRSAFLAFSETWIRP